MTNTQLLKDIIQNRGFRMDHVAKTLDLTPQGLYNKLNGDKPNEFKSSEIKKLIELLDLTQEELNAIFFD